MRIFFVGGGTIGSVTPLRAVAELLHEHDLHFVGTARGVERAFIEQPSGDKSNTGPTFTYHAVLAGKWRRYWDWRNITDIAKIAVALLQGVWLMLRYRPAVVVSAGSFIAVPIVWAAWLTGRNIVVHQPDVQVSLATRLTAPLADVLTKAFDATVLPGAKHIGNPVRNLQPTTNTLPIDSTYPTVLVVGGGTGATALADYITPQLCEAANVIHVTGRNKPAAKLTHARYHAYEFLNEEMKEALHKATVVVTRAGLGFISEIAALGKPAYIIPMPHSHQTINADHINLYNGAIIIDQLTTAPETFTRMLLATLQNTKQQHSVSANIQLILPPRAAEALATEITQLCSLHIGR